MDAPGNPVSKHSPLPEVPSSEQPQSQIDASAEGISEPPQHSTPAGHSTAGGTTLILPSGLHLAPDGQILCSNDPPFVQADFASTGDVSSVPQGDTTRVLNIKLSFHYQPQTSTSEADQARLVAEHMRRAFSLPQDRCDRILAEDEVFGNGSEATRASWRLSQRAS